MLDIAIIGGGLSGLALARQLQQQQRSFAVFEARERFGGRILSHSLNTSGQPSYRNDLGPCWIWPEDQPRIAEFIRQHQLHTTPQWIEGESLYQAEHSVEAQRFTDHSTYASARRLSAGSYDLIDTLLRQLPNGVLNLNHVLKGIMDKGDHVELQFEHQSVPVTVKAKQVVLCMPPRLLLNSIEFAPQLSTELQQIMQNISTWMAGHAKAIIYYKTAFWREAGFSGSAFSGYQGAALGEIFDSSSDKHEQAALAGFFALPAALRRDYKNDLSALIVEQLVRLFGEKAAQPESIIIHDWFNEPFTATDADETSPLFHPSYGHPALQMDHWNDKLFFCGTETAQMFGGYLEGALVSADRVARALELSFQTEAKGVPAHVHI